MSGWNLPPGVSVSRIPGNEPESDLYEKVYGMLTRAWAYGYTLSDIEAIWEDICDANEIPTMEEASDDGLPF